MHLESACWPDLVGAVDVVLVPVGSCEQHGPHLPFVTDSTVADAVTRGVVRVLRAAGVRAVGAPALGYGASGEHQGFPGTISIGHVALTSVLLELGRSACTWASRMVLVNGHGGNAPSVRAAVRRLRYEGRDASWLACSSPGGDAHAGRTETSLMSLLTPDAVRLDAAEVGARERLELLLPRMRTGGVAAVAPNGVLGDPLASSVEEGELLLAGLVDRAASLVLDGSVDDAGRLRAGEGR